MEIEFTFNEFLLAAAVVFSLLLVPVEIALSFIYLIFVPGFAVSSLLFGKIERHKLAILSIGAGVALIPIFSFLFKLFSVPLNFLTINITVLGLFLFFVFKNFKKIRNVRIKFKKSFDIHIIILVIILLLGIFSRICPVMDMNAAPFADPAVEGTIARLIVNNGGIPDTWEPLLNLELEHQTGFASIVAWFHIISGISIPRVILFLTSILHGLFPLAIYLLITPLFKGRTRPLIAGLLALVSAFPTFIFVAGMNSGVTMYFLLPFILFLVFRNFSKPARKEMALLSLLSIGCFLIHPIYLFFLVLFSFPFIVFHKPKNNFFKNTMILFLFALLIPCLIFLPKILDTFTPGSVVSGLAEEQWEIQRGYTNSKKAFYPLMLIDPIFTNFNNVHGFWHIYLENILYMQIFNFIPAIFLSVVFFFSLYVIFREKSRTGWMAVSWYLLIFFFGTLQSVFAFEFPGWQYIYTTRVKFLAMIPLSVILSFGFMRLKKINAKSLRKNFWKSAPFLLLLLYIPFGLLFIHDHLSDLSQRKGLSDDDMGAIMWIRENTEQDAIILNTIGDIEAGAFVGGPGQWIPVIAGRSVIFPATSLTEDVTPLQERTVLMDYMETGNVSSTEFKTLLNRYKITHIFLTDSLFHSRKNFSKIGCDVFRGLEYKLVFENGENCIFQV